MAKQGYRFLDSDMHVFEPHDLYLRYMDPRWGDKIPRAEPRRAYGFHRFAMADGAPVRKSRIPDAVWGDERGVNRERDVYAGPRFQYGLEHDFDAASQVKAMNDEGIDVAVMFRTFPPILDEELDPEYALALARAWNDWITDFC